jgi:lipoprotein LprG
MPAARFAPVLALVLALLLPLAACTDDGGSDEPVGDVQDRLDAAKATLDDAASIRIDLSTDALPDGTTGLLSATGVGTHDPAFEGDVTVAVAGAEQDAEVVAVDGAVQAKLGFTPEYIPVDPASLGAPDPANFFSTETGVSSFLAATIDPVEGEQTRVGEEVLTQVTGSLPGDVVKDVVPTAEANAEFDVTYDLTDDDVLRSATITGPFYPGGEDVTYDLTAEASDEAVTITAP